MNLFPDIMVLHKTSWLMTFNHKDRKSNSKIFALFIVLFLTRKHMELNITIPLTFLHLTICKDYFYDKCILFDILLAKRMYNEIKSSSQYLYTLESETKG